MLSAIDQQWLSTNAWSVEHDFAVHALYQGEPFLIEGLLCFFDGETLFICCRGLPQGRSDIVVACDRILRTWPWRKPRRINCWGDAVPAGHLFRSCGYVLIYEHVQNPHNDEVIIDLSQGSSQRRIRRRQRETRSRAQDYVCLVNPGGGFRWEEICLLRDFMQELASDFDSVDLSYYLTVPPFLASSHPEQTIRVALITGGRIGGFAFARVLNKEFAALHVVVWDRRLPHACDALYAAVIAEVERRRIRRCSLGVTLHEGLFRYKSKWGATPVGHGLAQAIWCDGQDEVARDLSGYHWPTSAACRYFESQAALLAGRTGRRMDYEV